VSWCQLKLKSKITMSFESWIRDINALLFKSNGYSIESLPDEPFQDYYHDGLLPNDVVEIMLAQQIYIEEVLMS